MKTFGERLRSLIKSSDFKTIKSFSEKIGVSEVTVSRIVTSKNNPSYEFIMSCLEVFNDGDVTWLVTGRFVQEELKLENKHLKERLQLSENKISRLAKYSSNRVSPQIPFPEFIPVYNG